MSWRINSVRATKGSLDRRFAAVSSAASRTSSCIWGRTLARSHSSVLIVPEDLHLKAIRWSMRAGTFIKKGIHVPILAAIWASIGSQCELATWTRSTEINHNWDVSRNQRNKSWVASNPLTNRNLRMSGNISISLNFTWNSSGSGTRMDQWWTWMSPGCYPKTLSLRSSGFRARSGWLISISRTRVNHSSDCLSLPPWIIIIH